MLRLKAPTGRAGLAWVAVFEKRRMDLIPTFEKTVEKLVSRLEGILEEGRTRLPAEMVEGESAAPLVSATEEARAAIARALRVVRGGAGDGEAEGGAEGVAAGVAAGGGATTEHEVNQAIIAVHYANQKVQGVVILESWVHEIRKEEEALQAMQEAEMQVNRCCVV